jgi:putative transposase
MNAETLDGSVNPRHRPPRLPEIFAGEQPFYFVTFNTYRRKRLLANAGTHGAFVQFCEAGVPRGAGVGRYVMMPDHVHLFVKLASEGVRLADWVKALRSVLGKRMLADGVERPHWQEGFFDHLLRSSESYGEKWEYVRMNPVRAGLCERPEEWPYQGEIVRVPF